MCINTVKDGRKHRNTNGKVYKPWPLRFFIIFIVNSNLLNTIIIVSNFTGIYKNNINEGIFLRYSMKSFANRDVAKAFSKEWTGWDPAWLHNK